MTACLSGKTLRAGTIGLRVLALCALQAARLALSPTWAPAVGAEPAPRLAPGALPRRPAPSTRDAVHRPCPRAARPEREALYDALDVVAGALVEEQLWFSPVETGTSVSRFFLRLTRDLDRSRLYRGFLQAVRGRPARASSLSSRPPRRGPRGPR